MIVCWLIHSKYVCICPLFKGKRCCSANCHAVSGHVDGMSLALTVEETVLNWNSWLEITNYNLQSNATYVHETLVQSCVNVSIEKYLHANQWPPPPISPPQSQLYSYQTLHNGCVCLLNWKQVSWRVFRVEVDHCVPLLCIPADCRWCLCRLRQRHLKSI